MTPQHCFGILKSSWFNGDIVVPGESCVCPLSVKQINTKFSRPFLALYDYRQQNIYPEYISSIPGKRAIVDRTNWAPGALVYSLTGVLSTLNPKIVEFILCTGGFLENDIFKMVFLPQLTHSNDFSGRFPSGGLHESTVTEGF